MNREVENFDKVEKFLRLKRFEMPPAEFFEKLPRAVIHRIRVTQTSDVEEREWEMKLLRFLERRPLAIGVFGGAICLTVILAILYSARIQVDVNSVVIPNEPASQPIYEPPVRYASEAEKASPVISLTNPLPAGQLQQKWLNLQPVMWQTQGR